MQIRIKPFLQVAAFFMLLTGFSLAGDRTNAKPYLEQNFRQPPLSARPWVYWFWCDGNVSREGITADLEAMKRVGIGGVAIFDVNVGNPIGPISFMSPQWRDMFKHAVSEADRLGLEVKINNGGGWAGSGGPWITPEMGSQKVVWSQTYLHGSDRFRGNLSVPPAKLNYYRDIAVLAFPTPENDANGKEYRIDDFESSKSFGGAKDFWGVCPWPQSIPPCSYEPAVSAVLGISRKDIVNLTGRTKPDGRLEWDVPDGNWTILRVGHTPTGNMIRPASKAAEGLECDKLSKEVIEKHFSAMIGKLISDVKPMAGKSFTSTHIDSWEAGSQNWTQKFPDEFKKRRGYDILTFLPVLSGRMVESVEISERFLWDFRETVAELLADNYAGRLKELANKHNMQLSIEAYGGICDDLRYASRANEPMTEFWKPAFGSWDGWNPMVTSAMVSAAHTNGKRIVGAEAFTAMNEESWLVHPAMLKTLGDWAFCEGVNRFVFHRYAHQPWLNRQPGMCFGPYGQHYESTQTWWEQSSAWHQYLTRCQFMLRQGLFVADECFLQTEGAPHLFYPPIPVPERDGMWPDRPSYNYDGISPEVVLNNMAIRNGFLILPDGMKYRLLVLPTYNADGRPVFQRNETAVLDANAFGARPLPKYEVMTPALLRKIKYLVEGGATVLGTRPLKSPSLSGYPQCDKEVKQLADELWGKDNGMAGSGECTVGKGRVIWGKNPEQVLAAMGVKADFEAKIQSGIHGLRYIHRIVDDVDVYFVANKTDTVQDAVCLFRTNGKQPEMWDPETGEQRELPEFTETSDGRISIPLRFESTQSFFIVFRKPVGNRTIAVTAGNLPQLKTVAEIEGSWELSFPPSWGAPEKVTLDRLISWTQHSDSGVKYFSGTATYHKTFDVSADMITKKQSLYLDLGTVQVMAEISLNGRKLGTLWKSPYRVNITSAVKSGKNALEIKVVNLWPNRMIGDEQLPQDTERLGWGMAKAWPQWLLDGHPSPAGRYTWASWTPWNKDSPLLPSGLIGPVQLMASIP